jgi:Mrp family chromosome partitioning ATPase
VDGDLRRPAMHRLFDVPPAPGFSELLRAEVPMGEATRATPVPNLWVMPAGRYDGLTLQKLAQEGGAHTVFHQLKEQYDFIVVDSSPVLPVADALMIGQHVDAVLFSIRCDVSRLPAVYAAYQRLETLGMRMLGAVVNGARDYVYSSGYRYSNSPPINAQ